MAHLTKDKGDLAVAKAIAHLLEHGIRVCLPLSEHLPFDLIAVMPDRVTLKRVQVKYRTLENGFVPFSFRSNYYNSKRIYTVKVDLSQLDAYATFCPETDTVYYLRVDEIPTDAVALRMRVTPPKNGQKKGIWLAQNYLDPYRIANSAYKIECSPRSLTEPIQLAIAHVEIDLLQQGWYTCSPQRWAAPFDLIAVSADMQRLLRVRVGFRQANATIFTDVYALYQPDAHSVRYLSAEHVPTADQYVGGEAHPAMSPLLEVALAG